MPRHDDEHPTDPTSPTDAAGNSDQTSWQAFITPPVDSTPVDSTSVDSTTDGGGRTFNSLDFDDESFDDDASGATGADQGSNTGNDELPPTRSGDLAPSRRVPPRNDRARSPRRNRTRVLTYVVGLAALIGGLVAVVGHHDPKPDPAAAAREDERASRGELRTNPVITPAADDTVGVAPTPTAVPTTPAPTTPAPPKAAAPPAKKKTVVTKAATKPAANVAGCASYSGNQLIACNLLPSFGFATSEMSALVPMWDRESGWNASAENPGSGAYGIPQSLPGNKMASAGSDWRTNPATQIKWGLQYIKDTYGSPSSAWSFWQSNGWY